MTLKELKLTAPVYSKNSKIHMNNGTSIDMRDVANTSYLSHQDSFHVDYNGNIVIFNSSHRTLYVINPKTRKTLLEKTIPDNGPYIIRSTSKQIFLSSSSGVHTYIVNLSDYSVSSINGTPQNLELDKIINPNSPLSEKNGMIHINGLDTSLSANKSHKIHFIYMNDSVFIFYANAGSAYEFNLKEPLFIKIGVSLRSSAVNTHLYHQYPITILKNQINQGDVASNLSDAYFVPSYPDYYREGEGLLLPVREDSIFNI